MPDDTILDEFDFSPHALRLGGRECLWVIAIVLALCALLLLIAAGRTAGLIIDPHTYAARRLLLPGDPVSDGILSRAKAAQLGDSVLYVLQGENVHAFRMEPHPALSPAIHRPGDSHHPLFSPDFP